MTHVIQPIRLLVIALAGWLNRHQQAVTGCLIEENHVLIARRTASLVHR